MQLSIAKAKRAASVVGTIKDGVLLKGDMNHEDVIDSVQVGCDGFVAVFVVAICMVAVPADGRACGDLQE
jgi:hypothetical protein